MGNREEKWLRSSLSFSTSVFFKGYLQVNNKASNIACRAKLGRLPLLIPRNQNIMSYFVYRTANDKDSIIKQSFLMSKNLHPMNNSGYYCKFINMFEQYNLISLDTESLDDDKIGRYTTEMREKYPLSFLRHSLEN